MAERKEKHTSARNQRIVGIILSGLAILVLISLISHSPQDYPNSSRPLGQSANWAGAFGALTSYWLIFPLGYGAYVVPILLILWGWNCLNLNPKRRTVFISIILIGVTLLFCSSVGVLTGWQEKFRISEIGGLVGYLLSSKIMLPIFGRAGSVLIVVVLAAVILFSVAEFNVPKPDLGRIMSYILALKPKKKRKKVSQPKREEAKPPEPEMPQPARINRDAITTSTISYSEPKIIERGTKEEEGEKGEEEVPKPEGAQLIYHLPPVSLLDMPEEQDISVDKDELYNNARKLETVLLNFGIDAKAVQVTPGPVITRYELEPAPGVKVNRIASLADDLALAMKARQIRILAPVPGQGVVGVEVPNSKASMVYFREIVESQDYQSSTSKLTLALGKTAAGEAFIADMTRMPHLLIAGATGSGKSVSINSIIASILFRSTPEDVRFIMIDPKMLELTSYNGIPHLLSPVVTDPKKASEALKWAVNEMESRYHVLAKLGVRNVDNYNSKMISDGFVPPEGVRHATLPYILIMIDELADLMLAASLEIEDSLTRLAQMSRAVGIHLVVATQRPSVDVITGVIKANFPSRIAFQVASKVDSRTVLDMNGAEKLLGRGDMLFIPPDAPEPIRIHGSYISSEEVEKIVKWIKDQMSEGEVETISSFSVEDELVPGDEGDRDELFDEALRLVVIHQQGSSSLLQRRLKVGYARAARLIDQLEAAGIVGPFDGSKAREVLVDETYLENFDRKD